MSRCAGCNYPKNGPEIRFMVVASQPWRIKARYRPVQVQRFSTVQTITKVSGELIKCDRRFADHKDHRGWGGRTHTVPALSPLRLWIHHRRSCYLSLMNQHGPGLRRERRSRLFSEILIRGHHATDIPIHQKNPIWLLREISGSHATIYRREFFGLRDEEIHRREIRSVHA